MPNASRVKFIDEDFSFQAMGALTGVSGIIGTFKRGPIGTVSPIINSPYDFQKIYGGRIPGNDDALLAERILNRGGRLRVLNIRHYTDPSNPATVSAVKAGKQSIKVTTDDTPIAELVPKNAGANYNSLRAVIDAPSNGQASLGYFNLTLYILGDEYYTTETYPNLRLVGKPTAANSDYLDPIVKGSQLVDVTYLNTSSIVGTLTVKNETLTFTGGTDGGAVVPTDIIGNKAGSTGFYAFDGITDIYDLSVPSVSDTTIHNAGAAYAADRADLEYLGHLDQSTGVNGVLTARAAITVDSKYYSLFTGGLIIIDPVTGQNKTIPEVADVQGIGAYVDETYEPWYSQDGMNRGQIRNAQGVALNLGYDNQNLLAQRQVNTVVASNGLIYLKGNYSGQFGLSQASFRNVVRLLIYIKKTLRPAMEPFLGEPNDFVTWKNIYNKVKPFFQELEAGRALHPGGWAWQGDQYATRFSDLQVNNEADVRVGKYLVRLSLSPVAALNEFDLIISLSETGIEFTDPIL